MSHGGRSSSSKKRKKQTKDEQSEVAEDSIKYTARPGKTSEDGDEKGNRLSEKAFRTHFRKKIADGGQRKKSVFWTAGETAALIRGHEKHGNRWTFIMEDERQHFNICRTTVDLKDKWRSLEAKKRRDKLRKEGRGSSNDDSQEANGKGSPSRSKKKSTPANGGRGSQSVYEGDVKIRISLKTAKTGPTCKLTSGGSSTLKEIVDFARGVDNFMAGVGDIYIKAGSTKAQLRKVPASSCVGSFVDPDHDEESGKPYVYVELTPVKGGDI